MTVLTANDFAQQMVAQARLLDPSFSGEVGTPERKIIDAVAQALADAQIDLTGLQGALDIDARFGANLDRFAALFGMQRQQPTTATGFVNFSRNTPAPSTIAIPAGTILGVGAGNITEGTTPPQFVTTTTGSILQSATDSGPIPIRCIVTGTSGNVAANSITQIVSLTPGVTAVTNTNALTNGLPAEDDNSFKVRFKNTWARNLAGTEDQYLALALSTSFSTKAVVIGAQSRFSEYIQVPNYDDGGNLNGVSTTAQNTYGLPNQWTTALSTIPFAKQIYTDAQTFVSNGQQGAAQVYYIPSVDFAFNYPAYDSGDALRTGPGPATLTGSTTIPTATITVGSTLDYSSGIISIGGNKISYTGKSSTQFTGCTTIGTGTFAGGTNVYEVPAASVQPNFTFINVFNPASPTSIPGLQAVAPGDIVLSEFSYVSSASRNDLTRNLNNAVDVFVDGTNDVKASCVVLPNVQTNPSNPAYRLFNIDPTSPWYYENYRRDGQPAKRPQVGNWMTPLYQTPLTSLPSQIVVNSVTYNLDVDYWLVHEIGPLGGSIRARDGIEWNHNTSNIVTVSLAGNIPLEVNEYTYDANILLVQGASNDAAQVTTDVVVHKARTRYFKLDVTVMYSANSNFAVVNSAIAVSLQAFLDRQYFGSVVQLSDLLETIHEVDGVDNVRWSNDLPLIPNLIRVLEVDIGGNPLHGSSMDVLTKGTGIVTELQTLYLVGNPSGSTGTPAVADSFTLSWPSVMTTAAIPYWNIATGATVTASDIQSAITAVQPGSGVYHGITVTEDARPITHVDRPIRSFTITYGAPSASTIVPTTTDSITQSSYAYDGDFFLLDDELPSLPSGLLTGDTMPGLIIRSRAQNTFVRSGLV